VTASIVSVAISTAALAVSVGAFVASRYRDRRDLMLKIHDHLITPDQQRGRRLIYQICESVMAVDNLSEDQHVLINNALSSLNVLGIYYERGYVPRQDVLRFFGLTIARLMPAAESFLAHRDQLVGTYSWPELRALAEDSAKYVRQRGIQPAGASKDVDR
jgi:hypothetical protein